ncbi:MAG: hypothetical protein LC740_07010 [Actinobacteria bacterium]|nr:hypothetical protein [Actinomycetota bacterium]
MINCRLEGISVSQQFTKMKMMLAVAAMLAVIVVGAAPVLAKAAEISVTGVVEYVQDKADGTPVYGIEVESTSSRALPIGYLLEGDYSAYVGQRITYGIPQTKGEARVLDVSRIEQ